MDRLAGSVTKLELLKNSLSAPRILDIVDRVIGEAALTSINILQNKIGSGGLDLLLDAVKAMPGVGSLCGLVEGQACADWSNMELTKTDVTILSAEIGVLKRHSVSLR